ncbi:MAG: ATP-binding protein [Patescibacteria group bacterium]
MVLFIRGSGIAQIHPDGSGLGLFIAKSIIDAHGGRIWTESEGEGQGSTFQFTLPIKPPTDIKPPPFSAGAHVTIPKETAGKTNNDLG